MSAASVAGVSGGGDTRAELVALLDRAPQEWSAALHARYAVLDEVLAGRRRAVVYPAAEMGRRAAAGLMAADANVVAFGDRDPGLIGTIVDGLPVLAPGDVATIHADDVVLVASTMFDSAICEDLHARGSLTVVPVGYLNLRLPEIFRAREYEGAHSAALNPANREAIEQVYDMLADDRSRRVLVSKLAFYLGFDKARLDEIRSTETIYFDPSVYELGTDEVVVDGGAYVGDTLESFLRSSAGRFGSYVAFEPDESSYARLARLASLDPARITAVEAGLGRTTTRVRLLSTARADSRVLGDDEPGGDSISIVGLDEYFRDRPQPSLIKMDIEGSEADALMGAAQLLKDAKPKLAVSAYHFPADLWAIPQLISQLMPGSSLYLRHYSREIDDTVCYALPPS